MESIGKIYNRGGGMARSSEQVEAPRSESRGVDAVLDELRRLLADIRHGSVTLIVQDGHVIQIDATRKVRLAAAPSGGRTRPAR
jgi:hypothetical protein